MRCRPQLWWWGLPIVAVLWAAAAVIALPGLEGRLRGEVERLRQAEPGRHGWATVTIEGRDAILAGEAPSAAARDATTAAIAGLPGIRRVDDRATLLAMQSPYEWGILRSDKRLVLHGTVPDAELRAALVERARRDFPGLAVVDELRLARGAPARFAAAIDAAFAVAGRLTGGAVTLSDTAVTARGVAPDAASYQEALTLLAALSPEFQVAPLAIMPPPVTPFVLALTREGDRLTLGGHVPTEAARATLLAGAAKTLPGVELIDRLQAASGLPPELSYPEIAGWSLSQAYLLRNGSVEITDRTVALSGTAADRQAVAFLKEAHASGLPDGWKAGRFAVVAAPIQPFVFSARRAPGSLSLSGHLPNEKTRDELLALARKRFFSERIDDRTRIGDGAPDGFSAAAAAQLEALALLATGEAVLSDRSLRLDGTMLYPQAAERLRERWPKAPPEGFTTATTIAVAGAVPPLDDAACAEHLAGLLAKNPIRFEGATPELRRVSLLVLDDVAEAARRCPEATLDIGVHGGADIPKDLAQKRAQAIREHLVRAGLDAKRLVASGHAAPKPEGDGEAGRTGRVEIAVKRPEPAR